MPQHIQTKQADYIAWLAILKSKQENPGGDGFITVQMALAKVRWLELELMAFVQEFLLKEIGGSF